MEDVYIIINYLKGIGQGVEEFDFKIEFNGLWHCEVRGTSIDGEEQEYFFENCNTLQALYDKIRETF